MWIRKFGGRLGSRLKDHCGTESVMTLMGKPFLGSEGGNYRRGPERRRTRRNQTIGSWTMLYSVFYSALVLFAKKLCLVGGTSWDGGRRRGRRRSERVFKEL